MAMREGIQAELAQFDKYADMALPASKMALYDGAGLVADMVKAEAAGLPFKPETVAQIAGSVGIAKFADTVDGTGTSISFEGYFADSGFPIPYFVRELQIGTATVPKIPFVRRAMSAARAQALAIIEASFDAHIQAMTGGTSE